ncbi:MAG: response regulator transcription factor [Elusimicrobia bacterium]|nr:response regulator transcription factor [Elusimicrobiota bacterium]
MRVLIIDDEASLSALAVEYFRLAGHEALACLDGESALALLKADPAFDVIVLDKRLPGLSGVEILRALKADPRLAAVPVIVLSASVTPGAAPATCAEGAGAGADLYMAKPFHPKELAAAALRLAEGRKRTA